MRAAPVVSNAAAAALVQLATGGRIQLLGPTGSLLASINIKPEAIGPAMRCGKASGDIIASGTVASWRLVDVDGRLLIDGEKGEIALVRDDLIRGGTADLTMVEVSCG